MEFQKKTNKGGKIKPQNKNKKKQDVTLCFCKSLSGAWIECNEYLTWRENRIFFQGITSLKIGNTKYNIEVRRAVTKYILKEPAIGSS